MVRRYLTVVSLRPRKEFWAWNMDEYTGKGEGMTMTTSSSRLSISCHAETRRLCKVSVNFVSYYTMDVWMKAMSKGFERPFCSRDAELQTRFPRLLKL
jgi:hypothetical protein